MFDVAAELADVREAGLDARVEQHFGGDRHFRQLPLRIGDEEVQHFEVALHGRVALRVKLRRGVRVDRGGGERQLTERGGDERAQRVLVQVHEFELRLTGLFREIEVAADGEIARRQPGLLERAAEFLDVHLLAFHRDIASERSLEAVEAIRHRHRGEVREREVANDRAVEGKVVRFVRREILLREAAGEAEQARGCLHVGPREQCGEARQARVPARLNVRILRLDAHDARRAEREDRLLQVRHGRGQLGDLNLVEIIHRRADQRGDVGLIELVGAEPRGNARDVVGEVELEFLAGLLRDDARAEVHDARDDVRPEERAPLGEVEIRHAESERGFIDRAVGLAPIELHRLGERGLQKGLLLLRTEQ